jgi:hypothetical protein
MTGAHMMALTTILLIISVILLLLAAINWPQSPISLGWLGVFFFVLAELVGGLR